MPTASMSVRSGRAFLKVLAPENVDDTQLSSGIIDTDMLLASAVSCLHRVAYLITKCTGAN